MDVDLREVSDENRPQLLSIRIPPEQARFVGGQMDEVMADAELFPDAKPWSRAVCVGEEVVGFVMISWDVEPDPPETIGPWFLWKLVIDERHQGRGLAGQVVRAIADIVAAEGATELLTSYVDEPGGPAPFYEKLGFVDTGDRDIEGEVIVKLDLQVPT